MPSQLAVDLSKSRVRAVEIDGTPKSPRVRGFAAADVPAAPAPPPPAEGEPAAEEQAARPFSYADALRALAAKKRLVKEPSAVALASLDCTFRDLELPFTTPDQLDKVIKFEAESHLQLVEIDSVVVSYQILDADGRGGSRLLATAASKELLRNVLRDLGTIGVDPQFADLHLTALYTALRATGFLVEPPPPPADAPPSEVDRGETTLVLECDPDLTHLLVARGTTLIAARAIRLGAPRGEGGDYLARLKREVQRTLFRLGPAGEAIERTLLLGSATRDAAFVEGVKRTLGEGVEVAKPFDQIQHDLEGEALEEANAEGTAALGVALRLLGVAGGSRVDFRQEEVRYARRFDQVKSALSSLAIAALVCMVLLCIERAKRHRVTERELFAATNAVLNEHADYAETRELGDRVNRREITPLKAVQQAQADLDQRFKELSTELGRSVTIPRLASGLDYLNAVIQAVQKDKEKIGRIEVTSIDLDVARDDGKRPQLRLKMLLNGPPEVDALVAALKGSPAVKTVPIPSTAVSKDGRLEVTGLDLDLVPNFEPKLAAKEDGK
jgi:Tfp pilus assembly PilM family ATPase